MDDRYEATRRASDELYASYGSANEREWVNCFPNKLKVHGGNLFQLTPQSLKGRDFPTNYEAMALCVEKVNKGDFDRYYIAQEVKGRVIAFHDGMEIWERLKGVEPNPGGGKQPKKYFMLNDAGSNVREKKQREERLEQPDLG